MMIMDIVNVAVMEPYKLGLRFEDGVEGDIDLEDIVAFVGVFEPVRDVDFFSRVRVDPDLGTIVWPNGADLDPVVLYSLVKGEEPMPG
jgi:hypothetical protein